MQWPARQTHRAVVQPGLVTRALHALGAAILLIEGAQRHHVERGKKSPAQEPV